MENSGGIKPPIKEVASKIGEASGGVKPDLKLVIGGRIDGGPKSPSVKPELTMIQGGKPEDADSGEIKDTLKGGLLADGKDALTGVKARSNLLDGITDVKKTLDVDTSTIDKLNYEPSIINPAVKERIKRIWGLKGVKRIVLGALAATMLLIARDDGPVVNREVPDGNQADQAPQAQNLTKEQLADLVKSSLGPIFFESNPIPPAFPIPAQPDRGPVLGPEVPKEAKPWDRIVMEKPGESLTGWAKKFLITMTNKEAMMATLQNAQEKGVKVPDPAEFGKMYDANPVVAQEAFDVAYRGIESKGAQLPAEHPLLQNPNIKPDPAVLEKFTDSLKKYIGPNNQPGAVTGDVLNNAQTTIGESPLKILRAAAKPAAK